METNQNLKNSFQGKRFRLKIIILLMISGLVRMSSAHEGPPFPIIIDEPVGPYSVSVWTDPDIGTGTFFVVLEPLSGDDLPQINTVEIGVEPVSGRLEEKAYPAEPQRVRYGARYYAEVEFDRGEMWSIRVKIEGEGWGDELYSEVEATPDGSIGPIGLLVYALPFVAVGVLWVRAMIRRRSSE